MAIAIARAGGPEAGQSEIARRITQKWGKKCSPQSIQYLADKKRPKPARSSALLPMIAEVVGLRWTWLATGNGEMEIPGWSFDEFMKSPEDSRPAGQNVTHAGTPFDIAIKVNGMELTQEALEVAKAFMELPGNERERFKRDIQVAALRYQRHVPDEKLAHLAAPDSPTAKRLGTKRKVSPGTQ